MFDSGELRLVLLKLIADQPRHGYDLIRAVEEMTHGAYAPSPGIVYPTLTMLQDMGLIDEAKGEGSRKAFEITAEGKDHLAEKEEEIEALLERLEALGSDQRKAGGAPIKRAVGNLLSALWHRATRDDMDEDTAAQDRRDPRRGRAEDRTAVSVGAPSAAPRPCRPRMRSRYLQQLCKHWAHNLAVEFDAAGDGDLSPRRARRRLARRCAGDDGGARRRSSNAGSTRARPGSSKG